MRARIATNAARVSTFDDVAATAHVDWGGRNPEVYIGNGEWHPLAEKRNH